MRRITKAFLATAFSVAAVAGTVSAQAATITSPSTLNLLDLGTGNGLGQQPNAPSSAPSLGISTITYNGSTTGVYSGTAGGSVGYTSPFGSGSNRDYFAIQPSGSIVFTFSAPQTAFALLFGTIDNYNSIMFGTGAGQVFTGADVMAALGGSANGTTTQNVLFTGLNPFTTLTASDVLASAFEFVPAATSTPVPEPMSIALLGISMAGLAAVRLRRSA